MFKLYYRLKIWKLKRDIEYYTEITGDIPKYKQIELNKYLYKLSKQKSCCYCPLCGNLLTSSNYFVDENNHVHYDCNKCLLISKWDFNIIPVPILIDK